MAIIHTIENIVRPMTFQVQLHTKTKHNGKFINAPMGTAFAISNEGHLVTALHVITKAEEYNGELCYGFAGPDIETPDTQIRANFSTTNGTVLLRDQQNDLAIIKLAVRSLDEMRFSIGPNQVETKPKACILDERRPKNGERIATSGYPLSEPSLVTTTGHIASNWTLSSGNERFLGDITANPGNSGGPVYLENSGKVIGVCVAGKLTATIDSLGNPAELKHSAGLTFIVPSQAVAKLYSQL